MLRKPDRYDRQLVGWLGEKLEKAKKKRLDFSLEVSPDYVVKIVKKSPIDQIHSSPTSCGYLQ